MIAPCASGGSSSAETAETSRSKAHCRSREGALVVHILDRKTYRWGAVAGLAVLISLLAATVTSASATSSPATVSGPTFVLRGTVAGGIKIIQTDQTLTFVFRETNQGPGSAPEDLVVTKVTHAKVVGNPPCVLPNGFAINSDGLTCEPGFLKPGQSASIVITTTVTGVSGMTASVRVCLDNQSTGVVGPCKTVSVKIA
jgi:hypothetical protein